MTYMIKYYPSLENESSSYAVNLKKVYIHYINYIMN